MGHTMRFPARAATLVALTLAAACGGVTQPSATTPQINAVNGVNFPILRAGGAVTVDGQGFGATQGNNAVLVTDASGAFVPCDVAAWDDVQIEATLPSGAATGRLVVAVGTDTLGPVALLVRDDAPFDPTKAVWAKGPALPGARADAATAALIFPGSATGSAVVVTGGTAPDGTLSDSTYLALAGTDGSLGTWTTLEDSTLPAPRRFATGAGADRSHGNLTLVDGMAYAVGGIDSTDRFLPDVIGLAVSATGQHVPWTELSALPEPLAGAAVVVTRGLMIVAGGVAGDSSASAAVYSATINPNGTLNGWFAGPPLPVPLAFTTMVVHDTTIYVIGGETGHVDVDAPDTTAQVSTVYAITLSPRSGFFVDSTWRTLPAALGRPRSRHAAFALDQGILVTGGIYPGAPGAGESEFAPFVGDSLGTFTDVTGPTLTALGGDAIGHVAGVVTADQGALPHPTLVGGRTLAGAPAAAVWWH